MTNAHANRVNISNTTNAQYNIDFYDQYETFIYTFGLGTLSSGSYTSTGLDIAYCIITFGLGGTTTKAADMITIGHPITGYPPVAVSANTYLFLGGNPYKGSWYQPGPPSANISLNIY